MPLFANPAVLSAFYDPAFQDGKCRPYQWSSRIHADFAERNGKQKGILAVCPNGGGKSSFLLGPSAVWTAVSFNLSRTAVTSASVAQLDIQTMAACKRLASNMSRYHKSELWDIQNRRLFFKPTESEIIARKSDEEGTQEGLHPIVPGAEFTILVDEGKSIPDEIYNAILKWTGWTRRMDVTSAGNPQGVFYHNWCHGRWSKHRVTVDDCPHISEEERERFIVEAGGLEAPLVRQALYSEFASSAGSVVLLLDDLSRCLRMGKEGAIQHVTADHNEAGLDLSGGGDETILTVRNGNKQMAIEAVPFKTEDKIETHLAEVLIPKWNLRLEHIRADAGGLGRPMIRHIEKMVKAKGGGRGEHMAMVYNQKAPRGILKENLGNRGTQRWYEFANKVRDCSIILIDDSKQNAQLCNRYYRQMKLNDKIILEPKPEAKSQGHPSPDRADAAVLCFEDYTPAPVVEAPKSSKMSGDELKAFFDELGHKRFAEPKHGLEPISIEQVLQIKMLSN